MKKIISLLAAGALALGLIGCSGDLHDASFIDLTGYGARGSFLESGWDAASDVPLTKNADGTYTVSVTGGDGDTFFAILECGDTSWNTAYRLAQPKSEGDKANVFDATNGMEQKVYLGQSADCCKIAGTKEGDKITLTITPASTYLTVKVAIEAGSGASAPIPFYLDGYFLSGSFNSGASDASSVFKDAEYVKKDGTLTYSFAVTFDAATNANWGQDTATAISFGIQKNGWATKYTGATYTIGTSTEPAVTTLGADANNVIAGLKDGKPYKIYVKTTPEGVVSISAEEVSAVTVKVLVTGINSDFEGQIAVLGGSFDGWSGWTSCWGGDKKYTDMKWGEISADGTVEITLVRNAALTVGDAISWEACGYWGEPTDDGDIASTNGEIKLNGANFPVEFTVAAGTFTYTLDLAAGTGTMSFAE